MDVSLSRLDALDFDQRPKDPFFGPTSKLVIQGARTIAAASQYPDLLTCIALLTSSNLASRVEASDLDVSIKGIFRNGIPLAFGDHIQDSIQATAFGILSRLLPQRLDSEAMALRRAEIERLMPTLESSDSSGSETRIVPRYRVQFDSAESAERAAWMLRGELVNETQVIVPRHNANSSALDAIAAIVGSGWSWVKESDDKAS